MRMPARPPPPNWCYRSFQPRGPLVQPGPIFWKTAIAHISQALCFSPIRGQRCRDSGRRGDCCLRLRPRKLGSYRATSNKDPLDKAFGLSLSSPGPRQQQVALRNIWANQRRWKILWKRMEMGSVKPFPGLGWKLAWSYFWTAVWLILDPSSFPCLVRKRPALWGWIQSRSRSRNQQRRFYTVSES